MLSFLNIIIVRLCWEILCDFGKHEQ